MVAQTSTLAEKLARLFEDVRKPNGSKYTQTEVVAGTQGVLTRVYLWKLRTGRATHPSFQIIQALADFFEVDTNYFSENEAAAGDDLAQTSGIYVNEIRERASRLDEKGRKAILDLMDFLLTIQKQKTPEDRT